MVSFEDILSWIVPIVLTTVVTLILMAKKDFSLTREATTKSAFTLEHTQADVVEIKQEMKEGFEKATKHLDIRFDEMRKELRYIYDRVEATEREIFAMKWRIDQLEKRSKQGGDKSPV